MSAPLIMFGEFTFILLDCPGEELVAVFRSNAKVVFGEMIANPALTVPDSEHFANVAHAHGVPLIVDNTFPAPINRRPFEWGSDIVTHSMTECIDGHGVGVGDCIVDSGTFDRTAHADTPPPTSSLPTTAIVV